MKKFSKAYDMYVSDLITKIETGPLNYDRKIYSALDGYKTLDILTEMYKSNDIDSSDYPKEYVDNRPAENEKISVRIYQLKAIPLPEYIKSIQHADDIQLTDTIIRMLNDMEMYSDKLMNSRGLSIRTNLHKLNELDIDDDYSPLGKFFNNSSYEAFKSFMVQDEIIKFYKSRSNIDNDMVTSKDMYIDTKCLVDTITIKFKTRTSERLSAARQDVASVTPYGLTNNTPPNNSVYIDLYNNLAYVSQYTCISYIVKDPIAKRSIEHINDYFAYIQHLMESVFLSLEYKTDRGYIVNEDDGEFLKYLVNMTNVGIKINRSKSKMGGVVI